MGALCLLTSPLMDDPTRRDSERAGNAIDFFVCVLGMSFNQAMEAITR